MKRKKPVQPTFGECLRNPAAFVAAHPDQAHELALSLCKLAALAPRLEQGAAIGEVLNSKKPALYAALADMPGAAVLGIADAARSASSAAAASRKAAPAWHAAAKRERDRLIQQGTAPRDIASKIARIEKFSHHGIKAIRAALK